MQKAFADDMEHHGASLVRPLLDCGDPLQVNFPPRDCSLECIVRSIDDNECH